MGETVAYIPLTYKETKLENIPVILPNIDGNFDPGSTAAEIYKKFENTDYEDLREIINGTFSEININESLVGEIISAHFRRKDSEKVRYLNVDLDSDTIYGPIDDRVATDLVMLVGAYEHIKVSGKGTKEISMCVRSILQIIGGKKLKEKDSEVYSNSYKLALSVFVYVFR